MKDAFFLTAKAACLLDARTGRILLQKNAYESLPPASMTKMMTALLVLEEVKKGRISLKDQVKISRRAASMRGSSMRLCAGEKMAVRMLLAGLMVASGNDAAVALAEYTFGSVPAFVRRMNERAAELGLENTYFVNPHGLSASGHCASAYDMCLIARELVQYEEIFRYTSRKRIVVRRKNKGNILLRNTNTLVGAYPGVDGLKTGYTPRAKYCLCATFVSGGKRYIAVVMGLLTKRKRNEEAARLLAYAAAIVSA
ncbi:D-alanyl-D-alanine carboxypeptidase [Aneurinibacillus thermoaerophilus]|uniref:D-alanyl-D-alanine carboxypeptidase n=1 Tax=Aneurinibacillus thermoaerophilus TaxID=143495 RepID=A0A1G8EUZ3_ANETH|nr:D-alanyl-D-alanine carboxypeptidase [Aneurinibacillus thermoaerophilus]